MFRKLTCLLLTVLMLLCACPVLAEESEEPIAFDVAAYIGSLCDLDLSPYKGKVIALHFYAADNESCRTMLPAWKMIWDDFAKDDLEIVLIHTGDAEENEALKTELGLEGMTFYQDEGAALASTLGVVNLPNTLVLNTDGDPASGYEGTMTYPTLAALFEGLGAEQLQNSYEAAAN
jgi:peroxiredoxin